MMVFAKDSRRPIRLWLLVVYGMIFAMVLIGGTTRLTGSGLSMVEWHPLMGAIPPIGQAEWVAVFERYQNSPQYLEVNDWMQLADFKRIFFWEYIHRLLGRSIGVVVGIPWAYFLLRGRLDRPLAIKTGLLIVLGGLQGVLGWYMVMSGLVNRPEVSHFRLAAHLLLAFFVAQYALWLLLSLTPLARPTFSARRARFAVTLWGLVVFQVLYGAFMAGTDAGLFSATFPDMNGHWLPTAFVPGAGFVWGALHYVPLIHWIHRAIAWFLLGFALLGLRLECRVPELLSVGRGIGLVVVGQFLLGVATVLSYVSTPVAVMHQGGGYLLLSAATCLVFLTQKKDAS